MTVYIATSGSSSRTRYHTDEDCRYIRNSKVREVTMEVAQRMPLEVCSNCDGSEKRSDQPGQAIYERAVNADPEDL